MAHKPGEVTEFIGDNPSNELAAQRTAMSFDRTAMASDRTLMAGVRTSFALIGFGFTLFQFFHTLNERYLDGSIPTGAPRRFGLTLVVLGIILLALSIKGHHADTKARRQRRRYLVASGLIRTEENRPISSALVIAILLLLVGLLAALRLAASIGPY